MVEVDSGQAFGAGTHPSTRHLAEWLAWHIAGNERVLEISDIVDTFLAWHEAILGWHHTGRPSNGRIEGTNNLLRVLHRKAPGFTNYTNFEARGILAT